MQTIWKRFHEAYSSRGCQVALLSLLTLLLFAATANAIAPPGPIVVSQTTWYTAFPGGGALSGGNPAGVSWAINSKGVIVASETYGNNIVQFSGPGYAATLAGKVSNAGAITIDKNGFLYVGTQYGNSIVKVAMNATTGLYNITADPGASTFTSTTVPACTGVTATDNTAGECLIAPLTASALGYFAVESMTVDSTGDLFVATDAAGSGEPYSIFECVLKCLYGATPTAPTLIFSEPINATAQLWVGGIALDPSGNLFFTDSAMSNAANNKSNDSHLNELTYTAPTYSSTPTVITTLTDATPGNYDDEIASIYINPSSGNIYIGLVNSGIYGLTDVKGVVNASSLWAVSNVGTKLLMQDAYNNFYVIGNTTAVNSAGADTLGYIAIGGPSFPGANTTAKLLVADNSEPCTPTLTLAFSASQYTDTLGSCGSSSLGTFSFVPVTVTFTAGGSVTAPPNAALTVTDTTSTSSTTVAAKGPTVAVNQNTWLAAYTGGGVFGGGSTGGSSGAINSKGVVVMGSSYGNAIQEFTAGGTVVTNVGTTAAKPSGVSVSGAAAMAIDSNDYLYASNEYGNTIIKFPMNTDGTYGSAAFTSTSGLPTCTGDGLTPDSAGACQIVPGGSTMTFGVAAMAFDKNNVLFISTDSQLPSTGTPQPFSILQCGPTCLYGATPAQPTLLFAEPGVNAAGDQLFTGGIAVDPSENVYFTDTMVDATGSNFSDYSDLYQLKNTGTNTYATTPTLLETFTPACAARPCSYNNEIDSVATDAAGNVYFADQYTGIYKIVNNAGTLAWATPWIIAAPGAKEIVPDGKGNFYYAAYNNTNAGDTLGFDMIGAVSIAGQATAAAPTTATIYALDNFGCVGSPQLTFTFVNTAFSAPANPTCGDMAVGGGSNFAETVTFTPTASESGTVTTTMTVADTTNGGSGTASVTGQAATAQPITAFAGITSPVSYGGGPYTLSATGGASGNPVVFSVDASSTATAAVSGTNGTTLTISGVGTVVIDANQAGGTVGSVTYAPGYLQVMITVNPATQTIAFSPASPVSFGVIPITLSAAGGASGNPVVFTLDSTSTAGAATLSGSTLTVTGAGSIVLDANQAGNTNYAAAAQVQKSIVVNQGTQTITITAAPTTVVSPATSTITATASSGLPVTLSLTSGSSIATLNTTTGVLTPTGTAFGNVVVTANQAGNANYAAATAATVTVIVNSAATVATPTITPASGTLYAGSTNTITITDATANAVIWYTTDGTNPLTSSTAIKYTAPFTLAVAPTTYTVNAAATLLGDSNSVVATTTYTVSAVQPTFTLTANPPGVTVQPGQSAAVTIYLTPGTGFTLTTSFACSGVPSGVTCSFSPSSVTPTGTAPVSTILTISNGTAALQRGPNPFLPGGVTFAIALGFLGWKKRRGLFLALVLIAGVICLTQVTGCGSSAKPSTTSTMTVTATSAVVTETLPISVTVVQ